MYLMFYRYPSRAIFNPSDVSTPCNLNVMVNGKIHPSAELNFLGTHNPGITAALKCPGSKNNSTRLFTGYTINFDNPSRLHSSKLSFRSSEEQLQMAHSSKWKTKPGCLCLLPMRSKNNLLWESKCFIQN